MKNIFVIFSLCMFATSIWAAPFDCPRDVFGACIVETNEKYKNEVKELLMNFNNSLEEQGVGVLSTNNDERWYLDQIRLRVRTFVAYDIPGLANAKIIPHLEFFWTRKNPQGWEPYTP